MPPASVSQPIGAAQPSVSTESDQAPAPRSASPEQNPSPIKNEAERSVVRLQPPVQDMRENIAVVSADAEETVNSKAPVPSAGSPETDVKAKTTAAQNQAAPAAASEAAAKTAEIIVRPALIPDSEDMPAALRQNTAPAVSEESVEQPLRNPVQQEILPARQEQPKQPAPQMAALPEIEMPVLPEQDEQQPMEKLQARTLIVPAAADDGEMPGSSFEKAKNLLRTVLPVLALTAEDPEPIAAQMKKVLGGQKEVLKALDAAEAILVRDADRDRNQPVQAALNAIERAAGETVGQAVFNGLEKTPNETQTNYYYYAFPVEVNGQERNVEMKVFKDGGAKKELANQNQIRIAVSLDTQRLGTVVFHITWRRDEGLTMVGAVQNEDTRNYLENNIRELTGSLEEMGHRVSFQGIKVAQQEEKMRPSLETAGESKKMIGLDIKV